MKQIRKAVFETNSSSSHSVHIDNETELLDTSLIPDENGVVVLTGGEFGWNWERYNDATTKANYASISASGVDKQLLIKAIIEQTGAKEVVFDYSEEWDDSNWSYIDHESHNVLGEQVKTVEEIKNYLFNPNCWLVTGNDNEGAPFNMFDFPKITKKGVKKVKYRWELKIENVKESVKFQKKPNRKTITKALENVLSNIKFYEDGTVNTNQEWNSCVEYFEAINWEYFKLIEKDKYIHYSDDKKGVIAFCKRRLTSDISREYGQQKYYQKSWEEKEEIKKEFFYRNPDRYTIVIPYEVVKL